MTQKIARQLRRAKSDLYRSIPKNLRVLHSLARIAAHGKPRKKKAFRKQDITRLVDQQLAQDLRGTDLEAPDIEWGKLFMVAISVMARKMNMSDTMRDDFLSDVVGDMVMGQSVMSLRDTGEWKNTLTEEIRDLLEQGYTEDRLKGSLTTWIKNKIFNLWKRWKKQRENESGGGFQHGRPPEDYQGKEVFEELFEVDGLSSGQMSGYMKMINRNPEVTNLLKEVTKTLERRDDELGILWRAYIENPNASGPELLNEEVRINGKRMTLMDYFGYDPEAYNTNKGKINYKIEKLRGLLKRMWPEIEDVLRDLNLNVDAPSR
jgi:hypothetical protein